MATKKSNNPVVSLAAGAISGSIEACAVWPMEAIKTTLQLGTKLPDGKPKYTGVIQTGRLMVKEGGVGALYRGLPPIVIFSGVKASIRFGCVSAFKKMLTDANGNGIIGGPVLTNFLAGFGAGVSEAVLVVTPLETLKTKLIDGNKSFISGTMEIVRKDGIGGLYQGLGPTIMKQASNQGIRFAWMNGVYKPFVVEKFNDGEKLSPLQSLLGGMSAGTVSTLGNNPFDAVKTRMQGIDAGRYTSTGDCVRKMLKEEGIISFYRGVVPRLGRVVPGQGIIFMCYESISDAIESFVDGKKDA